MTSASLSSRPSRSMFNSHHSLFCINTPFFSPSYSCLVPLLVKTVLDEINGRDYLMNGYPIWCSQYQPIKESNLLVMSAQVLEEQRISRNKSGSEFTFLSSFFLILDMSWLVMVWVATSVGTPTQPNGRDEYLR